MEGGTISGNTAHYDSGGGGVRLEGNAIFTMEGGEIRGNKANNRGGGVSAGENAIFTMKDGTISGNTAKEGGGVVVESENSVFVMEGGTISGNRAGNWGGGGVSARGTFIKKGGTIYGDTDNAYTPGNAENTDTEGNGHAVQLRTPDVWTFDKGRNATAGPEIKLYAKYGSGVWTYNDTSAGGVGDTTANWDKQ
jgi:hypothetical protein